MLLTPKSRQRTREATKKDFEESPLLLYSTKPHDIELWNKHIPYLPQDIEKIFADITNLNHTLIEIHNWDGMTVIIDIKESRKEISCDFDFSRRKISDMKICVDESMRGQGIGRKVMRSLIETGIHVGISKYLFAVGYGNGGYSWAKMGAELRNDTTDGFTMELSETIKARLASVEDIIDISTFEEAEELAQLENPDDPYHITRIDCDLSDEVDASEFLEDADRYSTLFYTLNCDDTIASTEAHHIAKTIDFCEERGIDLTLGKFLLSGTSWEAQFDFTNYTQMQRVSDYCGGFKTVRFAAQQQRGFTPQMKLGM